MRRRGFRADNAARDSGVYAAVASFLLFSMIQFRDGPFVRPHPGESRFLLLRERKDVGGDGGGRRSGPVREGCVPLFMTFIPHSILEDHFGHESAV